jgi:hypothetical protein
MKKIIVALLLCASFAYAQSDTIAKKDLVNRALLSYIKKQDMLTTEMRDIVISKTEEIKNKTVDKELKVMCDDFIKSALKRKMPLSINVDLNKATKEDLKKFYVETDKFTKNTIIQFKRTSGTRLNLILQISEGKALLALRTYYRGPNWLFINNVDFLINNNKYSYQVNEGDRDVQLGYITETYLNFVDEDLLSILNSVANTENDIDVRFDGSKSNFDFILKKKYGIEPLKEILNLLNTIKN